MTFQREQILVTGSSGFLGKYIVDELRRQGLSFARLGRDPSNSDILSDLRSPPCFGDRSFHLVIHAAGKAHSSPRNKKDEDAFYQVNFEGTKNLLAGLKVKPSLFIFISSCSVYGLLEGHNICEDQELNGKTPYAKSKILAEMAIAEWCHAHNVKFFILRLPLVVGLHPKGNLKSIMNAIKTHWYFKINGNSARKSMVLASDVARILPQIDNRISGIYNLTDSVHPGFDEIENALAKAYGKSSLFTLSPHLSASLASAGDLLLRLGLPFPLSSEKFQKMTMSLTFSDNKARLDLGWRPNPVIPFIEKNLII